MKKTENQITKLNFKDKLAVRIGEVKLILQNLEQLVQAISLIVVSGFGYYMLVKHGQDINKVLKYIFVSAQVIIALRGAYEFTKFLSKK